MLPGPMFRAWTVSSTSVAARSLDEESATYAFELNLYRLSLLVRPSLHSLPSRFALGADFGSARCQKKKDLGLDGESLDRVFAGNARVFYSLGPA